MAEGNGSPVTWRELNLVVDPIKEDVKEIHDDVKLLLSRQSKVFGVNEERLQEIDTRRFRLTVYATVFAAVIGALVSTLLYIALS